MRCSRCSAENRDTRRFCALCGAPLTLSCPACGFSNEPGERFCGGCGRDLASPAAGPGPAATAPSPQTYTPPHLAEQIRSARGAVEGERKQVTVLFADIKGSLELLEGRDPEEASQILDPALHAMMEAVHRYDGTVSRLMGDGLLALFGAPIAHEDHAARACYAALAMQTMIRGYAEQVRRSHGVEPQVRVGLNSGEVVVRAIDSDLNMDYSAIGQTVHLASRMEQLALPGTIRITGETLRLAEGLVRVEPLGPVPVRGLHEPVEVFELVGAEPARRRPQAAAPGGLTRFVGRDDDLECLSRMLERAGRGHGQVVALVGEPGVGKSRLVREFTRSPRAQGWLVLESGSVSYGRATPYLPVVDLLKTYFQIDVRDDARRAREKVAGKLVTLDETLKPALPAFLALLEVPSDDPEWQALDPPRRRQRTLESVKRLLLRESRVQPLILVFEDLHWIDSETEAILGALLESLATARVLLLVNYRPEYRHDWGGRTFYTQLRIDPLPPASAEELLRGLLGDGSELDPLKRLLVERTEGNPFFLEESVRALAEAGVLSGERGAYKLVQPLGTIRVPPTVQTVLAARMDRLATAEKRLLQSAAVIGKNLPFTLLHAISDLPEAEVRASLSRLQAAEFLYETNLFPELEYTFKHALTLEVAYGSLVGERRRALHARIVEALELLYPERRLEHVDRLAHHALRGEVWAKAFPYLRQAGAKAAARSANRQAVDLYEQALVALEHLPQGRAKLEQAVDLRFDLRTALVPLGQLERILQRLREAESLARELNDPARLGRAHSYLANFYYQTGSPRRAVEAGERALAAAGALGNRALEMAANVYLGQAHFSLGEYGRAAEVSRRNLELLASGPGTDQPKRVSFHVLSRTWLVWSLAELGEFAEAETRAREVLRIAERTDSPFLLTHACLALGALHLRRGDPAAAVPPLERGLELCRTWEFLVFEPAILPPLGYAYALAGRLTDALRLLEQSVEQAAAMGLAAAQSLRLAWLGEAHLLAGRRDEALELAGRALDLARDHDEPGYRGWALRLRGESHGRGEPEETAPAAAAFGEAVRLAEQLGMRPLEAQSRLGLGLLHLRAGDARRAAAEIEAAAELLRAMGMKLWLDRAEEALGRAGKPSQAAAPTPALSH